MAEIKRRAKQYKRTQTTVLKQNLLKIMRNNTPVDTGNLKFNATYAYNTSYGFNVVIDSNYAHYIKYVNEPSGQRMIHSQKVAKNWHYVDRSATECEAFLRDYVAYSRKLKKQAGSVNPLFTTNSFQAKVLNDEMQGDVVHGFGTYYKMNKRLTRSMLLSQEMDFKENDEEFEIESED